MSHSPHRDDVRILSQVKMGSYVLKNRDSVKKINYNQIASNYAEYRQAWQSVVDELKKGCHRNNCRILEIGCGTGHYIQALATSGFISYGIDPSIGMLRAVKERSVGFINSGAENLPFKDKVFDFVFSVDVIHHVANTKSYFDEALSVLRPGGMICTVTDSEEIIANRKPLAKYWPGTVSVDLKRYPAINTLREQMTEAGFSGITEHEIREPYILKDISLFRDRAYSCLQLISEEEFGNGFRKLEVDMRIGTVNGLVMYLCLWGRRPSA